MFVHLGNRRMMLCLDFVWVKTEVWRKSSWVGRLTTGMPYPQHGAIQNQELLWRSVGSPRCPQTREYKFTAYVFLVCYCPEYAFVWKHLHYVILISPPNILCRGDLWRFWPTWWEWKSHAWAGENKETYRNWKNGDPDCFGGGWGNVALIFGTNPNDNEVV